MIGEVGMSLTETRLNRIIQELEGRVEYLEQNSVEKDDFNRYIDILEIFEKPIKYTHWWLNETALRVDEIVAKVDQVEETCGEFKIVKDELQLLGKEVINAKTRSTRTVEKLEKRVNKIEVDLEIITVKMHNLKI